MNRQVVSRIPAKRAALGGIEPLTRRRMAVRVGLVLLVLALGLVVRSSGLLHHGDPVLPPLDGAAQVVPGVVRAGHATETELMLMRDSFHVRGVVGIGDFPIEEVAVTKSLGMRLMTIEIADVDAPSPEQAVELVRFVHDVTDEEGAVFLHDDDGTGPVLVSAAIVQLAEGMSLAAVLDGMSPLERAALTPAQKLALQNVSAALTADGPPTGPYAAMREVAR